MTEKRNRYLWNPVFSRIMEIKDEFINRFGEREYFKIRRQLSSDESLGDNILSYMIKATHLYEDWLPTVNIKADKTGGRVLLHYDQFNSGDMHSNPNSVNREARSIYIDVDNEAIILCPFRKFFNAEEVKENNIDSLREEFFNATVREASDKLDGSNQNASWYDGKAVLCGSKRCDKETSFQLKLGYEMIEDPHYINMLKDNPNTTFMFEFIHPNDAHVVKYKERDKGLYLIAYRNNLTGKTSSYMEAIELAEHYGVKHIEVESFTFDGLLRNRSKYKGTDKEGWVLNLDGHRIKIKTDDYLLTFKLFTGTINLTNLIIKNLADNTYDDFISSFPEIQDIKSKVEAQAKEISEWACKEQDMINSAYGHVNNMISHNASQKEFAIAVQKSVPGKYHRFMYMLRKGEEINVLKPGKSYLEADDIGIEPLRGKDARIRTENGVFSEKEEDDLDR